ncbi:MAG: O-antigen ligase family protein [Moritella sp.]|uniref:O-antigen ligase family protein n=1 Tax=Moritella sp. TaxID=78556 RepID=UPI0025D3C06E|nr:O-antigen ligase family protein [Moritella sp.]NQZ93765.1 O-antigen ligase family protein [Moritella sp.]
MNIHINYYKISQWLFVLFIGFAFVGLTPFSGEKIQTELADTGGGNLLRQLVFISFWILSIICFIKTGKYNGLYKLKNFSFLLLWCSISFLWAEEPSISIRRSILLVFTTTTLLMLINILEKEDMINLLSKLFIFLLLISFVSIPLISGAVHVSSDYIDASLFGNWKGVFIHKNQAGPALAFASFVFVFKYLMTRCNHWLLLFFLCVVFIYFTQSKTTMVLLFPSFLFGFIMQGAYRELSKKIIGFSVFFVLFLGILVSDYIMSLFIEIIENPEAFTGRATIWSLLIEAIAEHFWFGLGFGSVWQVGDDMLLADYAFGWVDWVFTLTHSHNGYLETFVSIGVIGFTLAIFSLFIQPFFIALYSSSPTDKFLYFTFFFFFVFHNMLETDLLNTTDGRWIIFLTMFYFCTLKLSNSDKDVE